MAPSKIRVTRRLIPPRRLLTQNRREKVRDFKRKIRKFELDYGQPGSDAWVKKLMDSMCENEVLTTKDIHRWIQKNHWIVSDDWTDAAPGQPEYEHGSGAGNLPPQPQGWMIEADGRNSVSRNYNDSTRHQLTPETISPEDQDTSDGVYVIEHQEEIEAVSYPELPDDDDLYSEQLYDKLSTILKHMGPLNKLFERIDCLRACLVPTEKIVSIIQRAQRKCLLNVSHKDALNAAATAQQRRINEMKMEYLRPLGTFSIYDAGKSRSN